MWRLFFLLVFLFAQVDGISQNHGVVDMDTIKKYHPYAISAKNEHFKLQQQYIDTLKKYQIEYQDFLISLQGSKTWTDTEKELVQKKIKFLQSRIASFENVASQKLESFTLEKSDSFRKLLNRELAEFAVLHQVKFLIDKNQPIYCFPCTDYTADFLKWKGYMYK